MTKYDDDHPEVIKAKAEAKARVMEARAKLHPVAQAIYALRDSFSDMIGQIGCFLIILIIVVAIFAPQIINALFGK